MIRDQSSSIDLVEVIMAIEESFEVEIHDHDAEAISGPREIVNWLTVRLAGKAMSDGAVLQLENLARQRRMPHLMQNLTWPPSLVRHWRYQTSVPSLSEKGIDARADAFVVKQQGGAC